MIESIGSYFQSKGWRSVRWGGELRLQKCPFCDSTARAPFSINEDSGYCCCHACGWTGTFGKLKASMGDMVAKPLGYSYKSGKPVKTEKEVVSPPEELAHELHRNLLDNDGALEFLMQSRCFSIDTIKKFKVGLDNQGGKGIAYPYSVKGRLSSIKFKRKLSDGKKAVQRWRPVDKNTNEPLSDVTTASTLFNVDNVKGNMRVVVTEGEDDCMILDQLGVENVTSIPNGANSVSGDWLDQLEPFEEIILIFDNDSQGQLGAEKMARKLGEYRCRVATLPDGHTVPAGPWGDEYEAKDITDFVRAGKEDQILTAIIESPVFKFEKVTHVTDHIAELRDEFINGSRSRGRSTGFLGLDDLIGGRRDGELWMVSGMTGSGKSTLCLNEAIMVAAQGEAVLLGSFEQPINAVMRKMTQMIAGKYFHLRDDGIGDSITLEDLDKACEVLSQLPIYFVNVFGAMSIPEFCECVEFSARRLNCKTVIFDHLHFALRTGPQNERHEIDQAMLQLKQLAQDQGINIWVVVHPRQIHSDDKNPVPQMTDSRGSSFISQVADLFLVVWRDRSSTLAEIGRARVYCQKCRSECGTEGMIELGFNHKSQKFIDEFTAGDDDPIEPLPFHGDDDSSDEVLVDDLGGVPDAF